MPRLRLRCKTCDVEFTTNMSLEREVFEDERLEDIFTGRSHTCPSGHTNQYDRCDYHFEQSKSEPLTQPDK
jgi:hypothetical protein